ncbi:flagellin lysine-N-methylase [Brenneria populi subsp. brevivirga]|uniref:flagellin lysine-N-methylase n=1 Tax=Brenneria populi TaxID=1505588 RepID=UPI002E16E64F|nr:flagellin lysine-N-methylase [Brenneria populi subsp. brevivirga]
MKEVVITQPAFMSQFRCIGSECRDHCCQRWDVVLDKSTYNKYVKSSDIEIRQIATESIIPLKKNHDQWAKIKLSEQGQCPFLDESRLCNIYKKMGEQALSHTCTSYPRAKTVYKNIEKQSLSLSCPESVRLLLSSPSAMNIHEYKEIRASLNKANDISIRERIINLMCSNLLMIHQKNIEHNLYAIALLLFFIRDNNDSNGSFETQFPQIEQYFTQLIHALEADEIAHHVSSMPKNGLSQWSLLLRVQVFMRQTPEARGRKTLYNYLDKVHSFVTHEIDAEKLPERMIQLNQEYDNKVRPWLMEREHLWRNYFLYRFYHDGFPYGRGREPLDNFYLLVSEYFIMKSMLAAYAHDVGYIDEDTMINIMYSFHTLTQHSKVSAEKFLAEIEQVKVNDELFALQLLV